MNVEPVDDEGLRAARAGVEALVRDAVEDGASIGFVQPLRDEELRAYVDSLVADVAAGTRIVLLARDGGEVVGMVQLELPWKPNARHRAELQKLVVHTRARRNGLGRLLLGRAEAAALAGGRTLLVLDTEEGSAANLLYRDAGWVEVGSIPGYAERTQRGGLRGATIYYKRLDEPRSAPPRALLLTGQVGSGKTSVLLALGELLERPHALVDLDWLGWAETPGAEPDELIASNLRTVAANAVRAGAELLVLARGVRTQAQVNALREAVGGKLTTVRLEAPRALLEARLRARDDGAELAQHLALLAKGEPGPPVDHLVDAGEGTPVEVARAVLALWDA